MPSPADPLSYFSFQPVLHDWCNKDCGMCYPVCGIMHIKEPLLLIGKSSPCGGSRFPLSLSEWSFTICMTPYNRKYNVLSASLNKTFPSVLLSNNGSSNQVTWLILHSRPIELPLIPASAPQLVYQRPWYVLLCLCDSAYKRFLAAN